MSKKTDAFFEKNLPAGKNADGIKISVIGGFVFCSVMSLLIFVSKFVSALQSLYYYDEAGKRFISEKGYHNLHDFEGLIENCFSLFPFFFIILLIIAINNYTYHFQGAKSIYTMLRVGRKELIKRCALIPFLTILISLVAIGVLFAVCAAIYILFLPEIHL